ncbi:MAG: AAC(3) family N-acetyltransferase [Desulfobacterales bacterium]|nr:AAC(3) family N-acetyltransferase [Desulfobacterales bacterium]
MTDSRFIESLFSTLKIPKKRILFLHVRLRSIQKIAHLDYPVITKEILRLLQYYYEPEAILVPAYTFSFMHSGMFHRIFSKSEVGRFSEEIRTLIPAHYRTPDPMYSVLDVLNFLKDKPIDYTTTFGEKSLFEYLLEKNNVILNVDMEGVWSTHFHQPEQATNVPYRFNRTFSGVVYTDETHFEKIDYHAFVRNMDSNGVSYPSYYRTRTKQFLIETHIMHVIQAATVDITWMESQNFVEAIQKKLFTDPLFLIKQ